MRSRPAFLTGLALLGAMLVRLGAQQPAQQPGLRPPITANDPQFDPASVGRGQEFFVAQCGFCHGSNARGGSSGPDLTRSVLVQDDEGGRQLGEFLRGGRPDAGMPALSSPPGR